MKRADKSSFLVLKSGVMALRLFLQIFLLTCLLNNSVFAECPEGAVEGFTEQGTASCYLFERFPAQFVTAERLCRDSHGHLASIGDLFVNDFVAQGGVEAFEIMQIDNFWVGGDDLEKRNSWEWISGSNFEFTNWAHHEPVDDARSFCLALSLPEGLWYARSCYESKPYVCEVPQLATTKHHAPRTIRHQKPTNTNATFQSEPKCNKGWSYLPSTDLCYKVVKDASDCYRPNTQEASVHSKVINDFIGRIARKESKDKNIRVRLSLAQYRPSKKLAKEGKQVKPWLKPNAWGLRDVNARRQFFDNLHNSSPSKSSWTWFDGSPANYVNWANKEPKKFNEFTCAELNTCYNGDCSKSNTFEWSSVDCLKAERAVCSQYPNY